MILLRNLRSFPQKLEILPELEILIFGNFSGFFVNEKHELYNE